MTLRIKGGYADSLEIYQYGVITVIYNRNLPDYLIVKRHNNEKEAGWYFGPF